MRELRGKNGNCFIKLELLKVIHVTYNDGVCLRCLMVEHHFSIAYIMYIEGADNKFCERERERQRERQ